MTDQQLYQSIINQLLDGRPLRADQMRLMVENMMQGNCGEVEAAALLTALRMKGETVDEIATAAAVLREHMVSWDPQRETTLDTCGTGGDQSGTFNISTATALVVAGCGVPVVKHGNRSVSSKSGSADVLAALGVPIDADADEARRHLHETGLAFCFAPHFHPALKHMASIRRRLGFGTLFNWLGPLANPAGATCQLLGVGKAAMLDLIAGALSKLGTKHALVLCSRDGLDEVSLSAPTQIREVRGESIEAKEWTPADFGLAPCSLADLQAADADASAEIIRQVLAGVDGPARRIVLANAAAALMAADRSNSLVEGVQQAAAAIDSGKALHVLTGLQNRQ